MGFHAQLQGTADGASFRNLRPTGSCARACSHCRASLPAASAGVVRALPLRLVAVPRALPAAAAQASAAPLVRPLLLRALGGSACPVGGAVPRQRCASSAAGNEAGGGGGGGGGRPRTGGGPLWLPPLADAWATLGPVLSVAFVVAAFLVCIGAVQSAWPTVSCSCAVYLHISTAEKSDQAPFPSPACVQVMKLYSHPMAGSVFSTISLGVSFLLGVGAIVKETNGELQKLWAAREADLAAREADRQAAVKAREADLAARQAFLDTVLTLTADFKARGRADS